MCLVGLEPGLHFAERYVRDLCLFAVGLGSVGLVSVVGSVMGKQ